jgi:hypothetical protein
MTLIEFRRPVSVSRDQLWQSLLRKAEDPVRYIDAITACTVLERHDGGLLREIEVGGTRQTERVRFLPPDRIVFDQVTDDELETISNIVEVDGNGRLHLVLAVAGTPERLARMHDYFGETLRQIVTVLHRDAGVPA